MKTSELKVKDLMVGDWVKHYNGTPMQVTKITTAHFACAQNGGVNCWEYNNKFEPIPLTPEILEKNGFELIKGIYPTLRNHYRDIIFQMEETAETKYNKPFYTFKGYPIFHAHELQHALKLCKIDKEIVV